MKVKCDLFSADNPIETDPEWTPEQLQQIVRFQDRFRNLLNSPIASGEGLPTHPNDDIRDFLDYWVGNPDGKRHNELHEREPVRFDEIKPASRYDQIKWANQRKVTLFNSDCTKEECYRIASLFANIGILTTYEPVRLGKPKLEPVLLGPNIGRWLLIGTSISVRLLNVLGISNEKFLRSSQYGRSRMNKVVGLCESGQTFAKLAEKLHEIFKVIDRFKSEVLLNTFRFVIIELGINETVYREYEDSKEILTSIALIFKILHAFGCEALKIFLPYRAPIHFSSDDLRNDNLLTRKDCKTKRREIRSLLTDAIKSANVNLGICVEIVDLERAFTAPSARIEHTANQIAGVSNLYARGTGLCRRACRADLFEEDKLHLNIKGLSRLAHIIYRLIYKFSESEEAIFDRFFPANEEDPAADDRKEIVNQLRRERNSLRKSSCESKQHPNDRDRSRSPV